jgi:transcriptional regulator with XRE-family HTH domain
MMIGKKILQVRMDSELTQDELCAKISITRGALQNIETGVYAPGIDVLVAIHSALPVSMDELIEEEFPDSEDAIKEQNLLIGQKIKHIRKERGYTQAEFADAMGYASSAQVSFVESGKRGMSRDKIVQFCKIFNISVNDLFADMPEEPDGIFIDYKSEHCDLIKDFIMLCNSKEKPEFFSSIENLISLSVTKLKELEKISETHT